MKSSRSGLCSKKLKVVADRARLRVLALLMKGPKRVAEINAELGLEQSLLSHHLRVLRDEGLVRSARQGKSVVYRLATKARAKSPEGINLGCCELTFET